MDLEKLRQVKFIACNNANKKYILGNEYNGWFHGFSYYRDGEQADTYAICETEDGDIIETYVTNIKFNDWV